MALKIVPLCISLAAPGVTLIAMLSTHKAQIEANQHKITSLSTTVDHLQSTVSMHEENIALLQQRLLDSGSQAQMIIKIRDETTSNALSVWKRLSSNSTQIQQNRADIEVLKNKSK